MDLLGAIGWEITDRVGRIGGWDGVSPHGIGIAAGYLAGSWWMLREGRKRGLGEDDMSTVLLRALVGAILGARFFYVLAHFGEFENPVDMLKIWEGGISLIGGIFGAIILAYPYMRKARMGFLRTMDSAAIGLAFGILFGRVGDLIIGDHLGKPTSWLLSFVYEGGPLSGYACSSAGCTINLSGGLYQVVSPGSVELYQSADPVPILLQSGIGVHQTALYDFISTFFLFGFLVWLARRPRHEGLLITVFGLWYGAMRIVTDFLRVDKRFFGLTGSQWASVAVATICAVALLKWSMRGRVEPAAVAAGTGAGEEPPPPPVGPPDEGPERMESEGGPPPELPPEATPEPEPEPAPAPEPAVGFPGPGPARVGGDSVTSYTPPPDPTRPR